MFWFCSSGGSICLVLISVGLGIICVLLLVFIILQYITITAERDLIKSLQDNYTDLMTDKHQLQNNFSSCSHTNVELESKVTSLGEELKKETSKGGQYKYLLLIFCFFIFNVDGLIKCMFLCGSGSFFVSNELKNWSDSRQYCRDRGADLIIINTDDKQVSLCECLLMMRGITLIHVFIHTQRFISSLVKERAWIGLSDIQQEGNMTWVDNSTLKQG